MPYIDKEARVYLLSGGRPRNAGELNYMWYLQCLIYIEDNGESYQSHNDIMGVFSSCSKEWYRNEVVPYEDKKKQLNGGVKLGKI